MTPVRFALVMALGAVCGVAALLMLVWIGDRPVTN